MQVREQQMKALQPMRAHIETIVGFSALGVAALFMVIMIIARSRSAAAAADAFAQMQEEQESQEKSAKQDIELYG